MSKKELDVAIDSAVKAQQKYWNTYDKQPGYKKYSIETFIDDALYGLGLAVDPSQFQYAKGYDCFKKILMDHITSDK